MSMTIRKPHTWGIKSKMVTRGVSDTKLEMALVAFYCEHCEKTHIARVDHATWHTTLRCKCGSNVTVRSQREARGKCKKCQTPFYNIIMLNELQQIRCRRCSSEIDLFIGRDGKLTT